MPVFFQISKRFCRANYESLRITTMPVITVLMPVFNAEAFVGHAVESILSQTFKDFEFLVIDDCSTDDSVDIVKSFKDSRIRLVRNETNLKLARTLNKGLDLAKGEFIARMDSDDISRPDRFERQMEYLKRHAGTGICGSWYRTITEKNRMIVKYPLQPDELKAYCLFDNPLCHPSVIMRRNLMLKYALRFDPSANPAEDYDLWVRSLRCFDVGNIGEVLLDYRVLSTGMTGAEWNSMDRKAMDIQKALLNEIGVDPSVEDLLLHRRIGRGIGLQHAEDISRAELWLLRLMKSGAGCAYDPIGLQKAAARVWFKTCINTLRMDPSILRYYRSSPFRRGYDPSLFERLLMFGYWIGMGCSVRQGV